jgi:hypothetical protein
MIELLLTNTTPWQFDLCQDGDEDATFNSALCTPPRLYRQEWSQAAGPGSFWYDSTNDRYVIQTNMTEVGTAGTGNVRTIVNIDPETGIGTQVPTHIGLITSDRNVTLGSYGLNYVFRLSAGPPASPSNSILETDNLTGRPSATQIANPVAIGTDYGSLVGTRGFHLNRTDLLIAIPSTASLRVWNYDTATLIREIGYPNENLTFTMLYEDDEVSYIVMNTPVTNQFDIMKVNIVTGTTQMYTTVQPIAGTDNEVKFAFDTKRKILAVYHQRAINATTGGNEDVLEFFKITPAPVQITDPTPLSIVRVDERVKMISHVLGDHGEAGVGKNVTVTNSGSGVVLTPSVTPIASGTFSIDYKAPAVAGVDTITNTAEV